jgi:hypothetical protein
MIDIRQGFNPLPFLYENLSAITPPGLISSLSHSKFQMNSSKQVVT